MEMPSSRPATGREQFAGKTILVLEDDELVRRATERLLEIAERCPVHRTLHSEVRIATALEEAADSSTG